MKILFIAAEVAPYVSVGGLSQVMYFLPKSLMKAGHEVLILTPKHGAMAQTVPQIKNRHFNVDYQDLAVPIMHDNGRLSAQAEINAQDSQRDKTAMEFGGAVNGRPDGENVEQDFSGEIKCNILGYTPKRKTNPPVVFVDNQEYFGSRANVFGYADDHTRFAFFSKAALEWLLAQHKKKEAGEDVWWPDVIHCHDWHAAYFIDLARRDDRYADVMSGISLLLTVHNFKFQGNDDFRYKPEEEQDNGLTPLAPITSKALQRQNALKRGLLFADSVSTVSKTHVTEVQTEEYAEGLVDVMQKISGKLVGILNGIDVHEFNPASDEFIQEKFKLSNFIEARRKNKLDLQKTFELPQDEDKPVIAFVGRLTPQKGWDLMLETLPPLLQERPDVQLIVLGTGMDQYRDALQQLQTDFPKQVGLHLQPDFRMPRKIFSGADILLVPSLFEPGGIVALEALRYGAVPLVRRTGGLNDSIEDFNPVTQTGNGFSFNSKTPWALYGCIAEALATYEHPKFWQKLVKNCMRSDFSWDHSAREYEAWYKNKLK